ncbi:hypothetical protein ACFWNK_20560 [Streptomyces sp. NPDC058417]|uniref:hypothetical protein n=1 Tax=unclassified Streptomyces TaxID=2593676 RepID=UPI0036535CFC
MHPVTRRVRLPLSGLLAVSLVWILPGSAAADWPPGKGTQGDTRQSGGSSAGTLISKVTYSGSVRSRRDGSGLRPVTDWTPPACWYEPRSVVEFETYVETMYEKTVDAPGQANYAKTAVSQFRDIYKDGEYQDYNAEQAEKGNWWVAVQNPDRLDDPASMSCGRSPFWVENGADPGVERAVSPQLLAEAAYDAIRLPGTRIDLAPAETTKVNLPTWAWLDKATFRDVSVTASLDVAGVTVQATTTARPVSLRIEPGTADATPHPASGVCVIGADGSIGEPYTRGDAGRTPPCGVSYLRSSGNGGFPLRATVTWEIDWSGTGGTGGDLPDGAFGTTQAVTVQEIQSVNR